MNPPNKNKYRRNLRNRPRFFFGGGGGGGEAAALGLDMDEDGGGVGCAGEATWDLLEGRVVGGEV